MPHFIEHAGLYENCQFKLQRLVLLNSEMFTDTIIGL